MILCIHLMSSIKFNLVTKNLRSLFFSERSGYLVRPYLLSIFGSYSVDIWKPEVEVKFVSQKSSACF